MDLPGGKSYFEVLYSGAVRLLVFHRIEKIKVSPFTDDTGIKRDTEYKPEKVYYILSDKTGLDRIQRRKASIIKMYPDNKKEIRKLFRKNKIKIFDDETLIQAFQILDKEGILH